MGIYIKGMEMPKSCDECFLPLQYCPYAMKPGGACPLIPVPPHGRLIDADALERDVQDLWMQNEISNGDWIGFRETLNGVPTIIPAEEGEA